MDQEKLSEYKLSEWVLIVDILGFTQTMAEDSVESQAILDLFNTIAESIFQSAHLAIPSESIKAYQYGDTINFLSDKPYELLLLAVRLQQILWGKDILAQMALSCGGAYDLSKIPSIQKIVIAHSKIAIQFLVGKAFAKAHSLLKGVKGPRIIFDEECNFPHPNLKSSYVLSHQISNLQDINRPRSEVSWWKDDLSDLVEIVKSKISEIEDEIKKNLLNKINGSNSKESVFPINRKIESMEGRKKHLEEFYNVLERENGISQP